MSYQRQVGEFPFAEARALIKDLVNPNEAIYWFDFLVSISVGWGAFVATLSVDAGGLVTVLLALLSGCALYRAMIFIHELTHVRRGGLKSFRIVWNLLCGFPLMVPSFVYKGVHDEHHLRAIYGTHEDGEYWAFVERGRRYEIAGFPLVSLSLPLYFAFRFVVLTPLLLFSKRLRTFVWSWWSSLAIIMKFKRSLPRDRAERRSWLLQEWMAWLYGATAIALVIAGLVPAGALLLWYCVLAIGFFLNSFRTLAAHAYRNSDDHPMDQTEQLADSVNISGFLFLPAIWAPVGLRYHATHHLFPIMPYHSLGAAHRRLIRDLPADSLYRSTVRRSLGHALARLWRETRASKLARGGAQG